MNTGYLIRNVSVTHNVFDRSWVQTQSDNWSTSSGSAKSIKIDGNRYLNPTGKLFNWDDRDYSMIANVRGKLGFEQVSRADVPESVQASVEFQSACPRSATVMRKRISPVR